MRAVAIGLIFSATMVVACSKAPVVASATAPNTPAQASPAEPTDVPTLKAGQWEKVTTNTNNMSGSQVTSTDTTRFCRIRKPFKPSSGFADRATCSNKRAAPGEYVSDCQISGNGVTLTQHMTIKGDFDRAFITDAEMTGTLNGERKVNGHEHIVWTYVGACLEGQTPQ